MNKLFEQFEWSQPYENLIVVRPNLDTRDPYSEACKIVDAPWEKEFGAKTLMLDTVDAYAESFRNMSAQAMTYTNKPLTFGVGKHAIYMPDRGDYRAGQTLIQELTNLAFDKEMHLIACAHTAVQTKEKGGEVLVLRGGAATVGSAQVDTYGGQFDQYFRLYYAKKKDTTEVTAQVRGDGVYNAKHREDGVLPPRDIFVPNTLKEQMAWWDARMEEAGIDSQDPLLTGYIRAMLYGEIGVGKTRLGLSFPYGPIVYVAVDKNSHFMRSMYRELKVKPQG